MLASKAVEVRMVDGYVSWIPSSKPKIPISKITILSQYFSHLISFPLSEPELVLSKAVYKNKN